MLNGLQSAPSTTSSIFCTSFPLGIRPTELWVEQKTAGPADYALAWWTEKGGPKIEGKEWKENLADGLRLSGERAIGHVRVDLYDATTDEILDTQWTDDAGEYSFVVDGPGTYYLGFHAPQG